MKTLLIRSGIFVVLINSILTIAACTLRPAIPQRLNVARQID